MEKFFVGWIVFPNKSQLEGCIAEYCTWVNIIPTVYAQDPRFRMKWENAKRALQPAASPALAGVSMHGRLGEEMEHDDTGYNQGNPPQSRHIQ